MITTTQDFPKEVFARALETLPFGYLLLSIGFEASSFIDPKDAEDIKTSEIIQAWIDNADKTSYEAAVDSWLAQLIKHTDTVRAQLEAQINAIEIIKG